MQLTTMVSELPIPLQVLNHPTSNISETEARTQYRELLASTLPGPSRMTHTPESDYGSIDTNLPKPGPLNLDDPFTLPAQIHYTRPNRYEHEYRIFVFTDDISLAALDLATTPHALGLAMKHNKKVPQYGDCDALKIFFSYPPRRSFPQNFTGISSFKPVTAYASRVLRPVVLFESRSVPIFFNIEGRSNTIWSFKLTQGTATHTKIDALDLADQVDLNMTIHTCTSSLYDPCTCKYRRTKLGTCSPTLILFSDTHEPEHRLYLRRIAVPGRSEWYWLKRELSYSIKLFCQKYWVWFPPGIVMLVIYLPVLLFFYFAISILILNDVSGGAFLAAISPHLKLDGIMNNADRWFCPVVPIGQSPCRISANPDVAGIGGRLAIYMQTISLITLIAFKPRDAAPSRLALTTTSLAFGISTLASAISNQLSLYHIILAAKFQTLPLLVATIVEPRSPSYRGPYLFVLNRMRWIVNAAIVLWYSLTAPCFGAQPDCNVYVRSQSYFTIGNATETPPRVAAIFNTAVGLFLLSADLYYVLRKYRMELKFPGWSYRRQKWADLVQVTDMVEVYSSTWFKDNTSPPSFRAHTTSLPLPNTTKMPHLSYSLRQRVRAFGAAFLIALAYPKFVRYLISLMVTALLICNIEMTIRLNIVGPGENAWTYGQILAVVMTVPPVLQLWQFLGFGEPNLPKGFAKRKRD